MSKEIYVIDHFALAFRSFYAFINNPLTNSKGEQTSVLFGYANTLFRLIAEKGAHNVVITKDVSGPNFRHELYKEYKANRSAMPEEMAAQLPALDEFINLSGVPVLKEPGFEADDIMASIAEQLGNEHRIFLFTKDKDMMQMVNENVSLFHLEKSGVTDTVVDDAHVINKFGVPPHQIRDLLALMGDAADNVPGVPKVGPKTAAQLLIEYNDIDGIYANLDNIKKKALNANLTNNKELAYLSQKLVSLAKDLAIPQEPEFYELKPFMGDVLEVFLLEHELNGALRQFKKAKAELEKPRSDISMNDASEPAPEKPKAEYQLIDNLADFNKIKDDFNHATLIAIDSETSGLDTMNCSLAGICISCSKTKGYYISTGHKDSTNIEIEPVIQWLNELGANPNKVWFLHNAKFDLQVLTRYGYKAPLNIFDTMIASYLLNPGVREHSLDAQVAKRLGHQMISIETLIGKGKKQIPFSDLSSEQAYPYSAEDAVYTYALGEILIDEIKEKKMFGPLEEIEIPLMRTLTEIEQNGISLNSEELNKFSVELMERIEALTSSIYNYAGKEFNISSPKQLGEILFDELGLATGKKTKTGFSTNAAVLQNLRNEHPIIVEILEFRELEKLKNTYVDVLPTQVKEKTNRVHTSFSQTIAATGRLSSINPNLQNIPVRTKEGQRVRSSFIASSPDKVLLAADYSQIELRVLAHLSQDEALIKAYNEGMDIHTQTAAMLFRCSPEEVVPEQRQQSKAVNFGILYGMSAFRLSNELEIPRYLAQEFIDSYFEGYPKVTQFIDDTIKQARIDGYVETIFGHRRYLPDIDADNGNVRQGAERIAVNTPIQGTAAGLIKIAMVKVQEAIKASDLDLTMLLQVHDELVFEVDKKNLTEAKKMIKSIMENAFTMDVPLTVEIGEGSNWLEAH